MPRRWPVPIDTGVIAALVVPVVTLATVLATGGVAEAQPTGTNTCGGQPATIVGTANPDVIVGTSGPDVIVGLGEHDSIDGLAGADVICGGLQVDMIDAGPGDDQVWGGGDGWYHGREGDWVMGGPGDDQLSGGNDPAETGGIDKREDIVVYADAPRGILIALGEPVVTGEGVDTIDGFFSVIGSEHNDVITAGAETDVVRAQGGEDRVTVDSEEGEVFGGSGNDIMRLGFGVYGGKGIDDIRRASQYADGGPGDDLLVGTSTRDNYRGGTGGDLLRGRDGNDFLDGTRGHNRVVGGDGKDWLRGGHQSDRMLGGRGNDLLEPGDYMGRGKHIRHADDVVLGGTGSDTVSYPDAYRAKGVRVDLTTDMATGIGRDRLRRIENATGGPGDDELIGDQHANVLAGGKGDDLLAGRGGPDELTMAGTDGVGPSGSDLFRGGTGRDLVDYFYSNVNQGVEVDLADGTSTGQGADTLVDVERVRGTTFDDRLLGDASNNILNGSDGNDAIFGRGGIDRAIGGSGDDSCNAELETSCEP